MIPGGLSKMQEEIMSKDINKYVGKSKSKQTLTIKTTSRNVVWWYNGQQIKILK